MTKSIEMGGELTHGFSLPMDPGAGPLCLLPSGHPYGLVPLGSTPLPAPLSQHEPPEAPGIAQVHGVEPGCRHCLRFPAPFAQLTFIFLSSEAQPRLCGVWPSPDFLLRPRVTPCCSVSQERPLAGPGPGEGKEQAANSVSR